MEDAKKQISWLDVLKIQGMICFYSIINVLSKTASKFPVLSLKFVLFYGAVLVCFFLYAFLWQQLLKQYSMFTIYSNRALLVVWSLLWSVIIFNEQITWFNILGVGVIIIGILVVVSDAQ